MSIEWVSFTTTNYVEVYAPDGTFISRHRLVDEAREAALNHALNNQQALGPGTHDYKFIQPETRMSIRLLDGGVGNAGIVGDTEPPLAPAGVFLSSATTSSLTVNWSSNSEPDVDSYRVYLSSIGPGTGYSLNGTSPSQDTSRLIDQLTSNTQYWVYVTAVDNAGNESLPSATVTSTTQPEILFGPYDSSPRANGSFLDNDGITSTQATWGVVFEDPLDGTFEYFDGGSFRYIRGSQTGVASFQYIVYNIDGQGNDSEIFTVRITVL